MSIYRYAAIAARPAYDPELPIMHTALCKVADKALRELPYPFQKIRQGFGLKHSTIRPDASVVVVGGEGLKLPNEKQLILAPTNVLDMLMYQYDFPKTIEFYVSSSLRVQLPGTVTSNKFLLKNCEVALCSTLTEVFMAINSKTIPIMFKTPNVQYIPHLGKHIVPRSIPHMLNNIRGAKFSEFVTPLEEYMSLDRTKLISVKKSRLKSFWYKDLRPKSSGGYV